MVGDTRATGGHSIQPAARSLVDNLGSNVKHVAVMGKNGKWYCGRCLVRWPCRAIHEEIIGRMK